MKVVPPYIVTEKRANAPSFSYGDVSGCDHNVARNILSRGLSTVGHTGTFALDASNALGELTSTQVGAILPEQVGSLIKESPSFSKPSEAKFVPLWGISMRSNTNDLLDSNTHVLS